ncbi:MAG: hypothetical protein ACOZB3_03335 [Calditrichota bacterium]
MDRKFWAIASLVAILLCAASTFLGVQSELLANRLTSIQNTVRTPKPARVIMPAVAADTSAVKPMPQTRTVAQPDQVMMAGF